MVIDRSVAPIPKAGDPELSGADHGEFDDRWVADGDQRLGRSGGDVLLLREGEDPRLVDEHLEGGVVAAQALDERAHGAGTLHRPRRRQRHARQSRRDLALFGESRRDRQRLGLQGRRDRQRLRCKWGRGRLRRGRGWRRGLGPERIIRPRRDDEGREDQMRPGRQKPIACVPSRTEIRHDCRPPTSRQNH